jgi:hypothetical protein
VDLHFQAAADALGITIPVAKPWWAFARAWLSVELKRADP